MCPKIAKIGPLFLALVMCGQMFKKFCRSHFSFEIWLILVDLKVDIIRNGKVTGFIPLTLGRKSQPRPVARLASRARARAR